MEKYGFVYIWRDRKHNRYYIGAHWGTEDDGYICSSKWMRNTYKRRPQDFKRKILRKIYSNRNDMFQEEAKWLNLIKENEIRMRYYNLNIKSTGHWTTYPENVKNIKQKISLKTKEAMQRPDVITNYKEGLKTRDSRSSDLEVRIKKSDSMKKTMAKKYPIENRRKPLTEQERYDYYSMKARDMWNRKSQEDKDRIGQKISESNKGLKARQGQKNSSQHISKIVFSNKTTYAKKLESYREKIMATIHLTAIDASKIIGVNRQTITKYRKLLLNGTN